MQFEYKNDSDAPNDFNTGKGGPEGHEAAFLPGTQVVSNQWASQGWEFFRVDTLRSYLTTPGCLGPDLLGSEKRI